MKGGYPMGAEFDKTAPFNQEDLKPVKKEVTISITLSKTVHVYINDYIEDQGNYDFSECDLKQAVKEQITLPQEIFKDWNMDDFEIILE